MSRVLTGIQASGIPHLGNLLGAIVPAIDLSQKHKDGIFFIADYHALTSLKNRQLLQENIYSVVATWLAFGLDIEKNIFFKQSDVTEVMELTWILSCFTPYPMLANAHSFKDKQDNLAEVNAGLFTYPVLMAADIILYDVHYVPVGKDQKQHVEISRDIANKVNMFFQEEIFVLPEAIIDEALMTIPGIDGRKMSKSYGNTLNIFLSDKDLKKSVNQIVTDSIPMEAPKNPENCTIYNIYSVLADSEKKLEMAGKYLAGNYGYGHAKNELFELIVSKYSNERKEYQRLINDKAYLNQVLVLGAEKARKIAIKKIKKLRDLLGYNLS